MSILKSGTVAKIRVMIRITGIHFVVFILMRVRCMTEAEIIKIVK